MTKQTRTAAAAATPLIKGYLPVRLWLPLSSSSVSNAQGDSGNDEQQQQQAMDETYFYVKQHFASDSKSTLFVANVPSVPNVSSKLLLKSVFARFGSVGAVQRVTVIDNPRHVNVKDETNEGRFPSRHEPATATTTTTMNSPTTSVFLSQPNPSFLGPIYSEGRFAHVVFCSPKEMKRSLRALCEIMSSNKRSMTTRTHDVAPGLILERLEIQTLEDETRRRQQQQQQQHDWNQSKSNDGTADEEDQELFLAHETKSTKGIIKVANRYRASAHYYRASFRQDLLNECNAVMEEYEQAEEADKEKRQAAKSGEPDEDGFVTVSYASSKSIVGSKRELDQGNSGRRKGSKRRRKKKDNSQGLTDFYRFQTKESRKKNVQDLRKQFEQDLAKVEKMKEERQYLPF